MKTFILLLALYLLHCQAVPVKRQSSFTDEEVEKMEAINDNLYMMRKVARGTFCPGKFSECIQFFGPVLVPKGECDETFYLEQEALCYVYDRYIDHSYSVLTTSLDSPLLEGYRANQYVAWRSLNSTCSWVRQITGDTFVPSCTVPEIREACTKFRLYGHLEELRCHLDKRISEMTSSRVSENKAAVNPHSAEHWLSRNLVPEPMSLSSTILTTASCTYDSTDITRTRFDC